MKYIYTVFISVLLFASCTTVNTLIVDVERPPAIVLPNSIKNLTIVNNSVLQPENVGHKDALFGREVSSDISVSNDSVDIILMQTLAQNVGAIDQFESVYLYENPIRDDEDYSSVKPITEEQIKEIANNTGADAILSIDKIILNTTINTFPAYDYYIDSYKTLDLSLDLEMTYYSNVGKQISPPIEIQDTIFWIEAFYNGQILTDPNPSREEAVNAGAEVIANLIATRMQTDAESVARIYYGDIKAANKMADANNWSAAIEFWTTAYNKETKDKKKGRIASNIALGYELTDNLDEAIKWITTSISLFEKEQKNSVDSEYLQNAKYYQQELLQRKEDFKILDKLDKGD